MGPKEFQIILDSGVYHAGEPITGKLLVEFKKPKKIKGIYLKYFGNGIVQWNEGWGSTMITHSNTESYLTICQLIFGNGTDECELPEGKHIFEFSCQLPTELPCSYEGLLGRTWYSVRAVIDQPWKSDYVAKQAITIMSIFDLNDCPLAATPIEATNQKTFWGQSKPLSMSVHIPVRGFVPGQNIPIRVILNNESEVQVKSITATLKQNVIFHATSKSSPTKEFITSSEIPVQEGLGYNELTLDIQTPTLVPSFLQFCNIIDIRYQLNVKARVSGCHKNLKISTEVIIGSIPLIGYEIPVSSEQFNPRIPSGSQNLLYDYQPPPYTAVFPPSMVYEDLPPPLYEQTVEFGNTAEEINPRGEIRELPPLYPVHKFGTSRT